MWIWQHVCKMFDNEGLHLFVDGIQMYWFNASSRGCRLCGRRSLTRVDSWFGTIHRRLSCSIVGSADLRFCVRSKNLLSYQVNDRCCIERIYRSLDSSEIGWILVENGNLIWVSMLMKTLIGFLVAVFWQKKAKLWLLAFLEQKRK